MRETLTNAGKIGLRLLEDLTALAAGGSVCSKLKLLNGVIWILIWISSLWIIFELFMHAWFVIRKQF